MFVSRRGGGGGASTSLDMTYSRSTAKTLRLISLREKPESRSIGLNLIRNNWRFGACLLLPRRLRALAASLVMIRLVIYTHTHTHTCIHTKGALEICIKRIFKLTNAPTGTESVLDFTRKRTIETAPWNIRSLWNCQGAAEIRFSELSIDRNRRIVDNIRRESVAAFCDNKRSLISNLSSSRQLSVRAGCTWTRSRLVKPVITIKNNST